MSLLGVAKFIKPEPKIHVVFISSLPSSFISYVFQWERLQHILNSPVEINGA